MDAEGPRREREAGPSGAKLRSVLLFYVAADTPHRALVDATDAGVGAARAKLGGAVEAKGTLGSARDGKKRVRGEARSSSEDARGEAPVARRRVRIELAMRANAAAGMLAEKAFADAFLSRLQTRGHDAQRL